MLGRGRQHYVLINSRSDEQIHHESSKRRRSTEDIPYPFCWCGKKRRIISTAGPEPCIPDGIPKKEVISFLHAAKSDERILLKDENGRSRTDGVKSMSDDQGLKAFAENPKYRLVSTARLMAKVSFPCIRFLMRQREEKRFCCEKGSESPMERL